MRLILPIPRKEKDLTRQRDELSRQRQESCYYLKNTGIPVNFGITIAIALIVGVAAAGQTFYLFTV